MALVAAALAFALPVVVVLAGVRGPTFESVGVTLSTGLAVSLALGLVTGLVVPRHAGPAGALLHVYLLSTLSALMVGQGSVVRVAFKIHVDSIAEGKPVVLGFNALAEMAWVLMTMSAFIMESGALWGLITALGVFVVVAVVRLVHGGPDPKPIALRWMVGLAVLCAAFWVGAAELQHWAGDLLNARCFSTCRWGIPSPWLRVPLSLAFVVAMAGTLGVLRAPSSLLHRMLGLGLFVAGLGCFAAAHITISETLHSSELMVRVPFGPSWTTAPPTWVQDWWVGPFD